MYTDEIVRIQREVNVISDRLLVKRAQEQVYIAIEEPQTRSLGSWAKVISSFLLWGGAALAVYVGIGFVVAEGIAWLMGLVK